MSDRRFTDKPDLAPEAVRSLPIGHPALVENRTLFPTTVVNVDENYTGNILVSGVNNRKLGATVTKGKFKGYALYGLSLEERATCPTTCSVRGFCYGNGMQMARRHRIVDPDYFFAKVESEITEILAGPVEGLLIRLHVLGDFPNTDYVAFWADMLDEHEKLACYGYTHRLSKNMGGDEIGTAIMSLKARYPDHFRIRWSADKAYPDGAIVTSVLPKTSRTPDGIVCPAQTDATACCASCGLCWEPSARKETIVFIKHGPKSNESVAASAMGGQFRAEVAASVPALRKFAQSLCHDSVLTDDLAQETVLKALSNEDKFEPGTNLQAWLFTILRNHFLTTRRQAGREVEDADGVLTGKLVSADDQHASMEASEVIDRLEDIPAHQRAAMEDIAAGLSYEETAEKHGVPVGTIKSRVNRGKIALTQTSELPKANLQSVRPIARLNIAQKRDRVMSDPPEVRLVSPHDLKVEASYQRDLSGKSIALIRKIVIGWDWTKFKPPVCAETPDGLFIIDGQHTALAAASHPEIHKIPVMVVKERLVERRADAFVAHNRDRLVMTAAQVFYGEAAAGNKEAKETLEAVIRAGGSIPRLPINKSYAKPGQVTAVNAVRRAYRKGGMAMVERIVRIAIAAKVQPINATVVHGLEMLFFSKHFSDAADRADDDIARALASIKNLDSTSEALAIEAERNRYWACATLIARGLGEEVGAAA